MQPVILISDGMGRTPLLKQRPQTPLLKKGKTSPSMPGELYAE